MIISATIHLGVGALGVCHSLSLQVVGRQPNRKQVGGNNCYAESTKILQLNGNQVTLTVIAFSNVIHQH